MLKIITYPNPILTNPNEQVSFPLSPEIKSLIDQMWQTVKGLGIGLAAPQVGANLRLCIIHLAKEHKDAEKKSKNKKIVYSKNDQDFVMINPEIIFLSQTQVLMTEGCLSFPDEYYDIWRSQGIRVRYQDERGKKHEKTVSGLLARVILHEVDHLNGNLFINLGGKKLKSESIDKTKIID